MEGMKVSDLKSNFQSNNDKLTSAARSASLPMAFGNAIQFNSFGMGMAAGMASVGALSGAGSQFFQCPIDVPFCERTSCVPQGYDFSNTESNAYSCYSQPGCCFDETLFQYRVAFGAGFYKSVPVCYRAIDNQLFNQLAQQVTQGGGQFMPAFVQPLVDQVLQIMQNPLMKMSFRQYQGCAPSHGSPQVYTFMNQVSQMSGNFMVMTFMTDAAKFNDFVSTLTQQCGWNGITANECVLRGCCWNDVSATCENPLGNNLDRERLNKAVEYMIFRDTFSQSAGGATPGGATPPVGGATPPRTAGSSPPTGGGMPPIGGMPPAMQLFNGLSGRRRRSDSKSEERSGLLNMFGGGLMGNGMMMGNAGMMGNGMLMGNTGMMGNGMMAGGLMGSPGIGGLGLGNIFGGATVGQNEVCPATNIARNCMAPSAIRNFDIMQKMTLERQCAAKGCCWDNQRYQQSIFIQQGQAVSQFVCAWRSQDYSMYGMPSLQYSLRGCCDYSPCVERKGRDGTFIPGPPPVTSTPPTGNPSPPRSGPIWTAWSQWGACSKSCGAGVQQRKRVCSEETNCPGRNFEEKTCYTNCDPIVWSPWQSSGCSATCGGGYETLSRDCISGPCPQSTDYRVNQPCNQVACASNGWNPWGNPFGNMFGG